MPRLLLVSDSSRSDGILALNTQLGKLMFMARDTEDIISFGEEAACSYHLLALAAGEAFLVPE